MLSRLTHSSGADVHLEEAHATPCRVTRLCGQLGAKHFERRDRRGRRKQFGRPPHQRLRNRPAQVTLPSGFVTERVEDRERGGSDAQGEPESEARRSHVERFERWARTRLAHGFSLDDAAKAVASSKRTLARRMHAVLGKSPLSYFQSLRVERAVHLLKTGNESVDEIATRVGYADGVTLRTLLRRRLGYGIREIRRAE
jgi:AraC-like DNA-binding protein